MLILHCGNEFLKQVLNFRFKLDDNLPRYGSILKSSLFKKGSFITSSFLVEISTNSVCYKYPWIQFSQAFDTFTITTYS